MRLTLIVAAVILTGLGISTGIYWPSDSQNHKKIYLQDGREFQEKQIEFLLKRFNEQGIHDVQVTKGKILIPDSCRESCNSIVSSSEFLKLSTTKPATGLPNPFVPPSEKERLARERKIQQLESILMQISGIRDAKIFHDQSKARGFQRELIQTALVTLRAREGHVIGHVQAASARQIVKNAIAGMKESDITVVDGDTGMVFRHDAESDTDRQTIQNHLDLENTRIEFEKQCREVISRFGSAEVNVRMGLEEQLVFVRASRAPDERQPDPPPGIGVVTNGKGKIGTRKPDKKPEPVMGIPKKIVVKRLKGIDVNVSRDAVKNFVAQQAGNGRMPTPEQLSRGTVALRNEITKEIVLWLRGQKGIEVGSDVVNVSIARSQEPAVAEEPKTELDNKRPLIVAVSIIGSIGLLIVAFVGWKPRNPNASVDRPDQNRSASVLSSANGSAGPDPSLMPRVARGDADQ